MGFYGWRPYVSVAQRRRKAAGEMAKLKKKGHPVSPVVVEGRTIVKTFWGKAWCDNLERYSDFENRLPRGRTYVRNGSVIDLQIAPGEIKSPVSGSEIYKVKVRVASRCLAASILDLARSIWYRRSPLAKCRRRATSETLGGGSSARPRSRARRTSAP